MVVQGSGPARERDGGEAVTAKFLSAEEIHREIAGHLVAIAGTVPAGTSMKEIFRRVETRLRPARWSARAASRAPP